MPPKNSCTPQSIYGGYTQTLFLGMSVLDFSATAGWNEQASTVTIKLVKDECGGPRDYFDDNFNWQTSVDFPAGDPGFNNAPIGSAAFFKVENFEFAGLIQSYNITEDPGGMPILIVNLISPNILLDGAQVITDEYQGSVLSMPNVFNVYGWLESRDENCPLVGGFGAPAGGFGNARRNERGIPWYFAKGALQVLLGGAETSDYSWHGGITYKQGLVSNRYGSIRSEGYIVDITDMPTTTDIYYRLTNGNYTLSELISEVCKDGGYEYYVDLVPCKGGVTPPITNVIKIRTVSRRSQPALGEIASFITSQNAGPAGKVITQDSIGEELRNDSPNSAFIVGAKKKQTYEQTSASFITPFWGFNDSGGFNTAVNTGGQWQITVDVRALNLSLNTVIGANTITFSESALLASMGYSQDAFLSWLQANEPSSALSTYFFTTLALNAPFDINLGAAIGKPATDAARPAGQGSRDPQSTQAKDAQTVFSWLKSYGDQVYGKQWLIAVPWVCYTNDSETDQLLLSDEPSTDGAWPNTLTQVLGMTFPSSYTDFFADEQGKLQTILRFNGAINTSLLSDEDYVTDGTDVWVKGDINEKWALLPSTFFGAQYAAALVTIPNRVTISPTVALAQTMYGGANFRSPSVGGDFNPNTNPGAVAGPAALPFFAPVSAAVPVKSNTTTYGPWLATASDLIVNGHPFGGKIYYEQDDGLAPWEYGGFTYMNLGAAAKIDNSITNETVSERGSVTLAGYPEKTLGLAITDSPSLVASRVIQNGSYQGSNYSYVNTGGVSTKAAQITNIQVTVGASAITTQYQISSFTPVFGRFSKDNAERIKQIGQQRLEFGRKVRAALAREARLAAGQRRAALQQFANMLNQSDADSGASAFLTGKRFTNRSNYNYITNNTLQGASNFDDYNNSAIMSMDGMQSPVQKQAGSSNLPKEVANPTPPAYQANYSESPPPPIAEYTPLVVSTDYLDFLGAPSSNIASRSDSPASGHNIHDVARGTKANFAAYTGTTSIPAIKDAGGDGYAQTDYRYIAHRGPLVVHGWGYDLLGKPVPNEDTDAAGSWDTSYANKTDKFKDAWLQDDTLWPTAPVDLRYDRKRGVWTVPPAFRILEVSGDPINAGGSASVDVLNAGDVYDSAGSAISQKTVTVTNITASTTPSGQNYLAYYDNVNNQYWPIFPGSGGGDGNLCVQQDELCCQGVIENPDQSCDVTGIIVRGATTTISNNTAFINTGPYITNLLTNQITQGCPTSTRYLQINFDSSDFELVESSSSTTAGDLEYCPISVKVKDDSPAAKTKVGCFDRCGGGTPAATEAVGKTALLFGRGFTCSQGINQFGQDYLAVDTYLTITDQKICAQDDVGAVTEQTFESLKFGQGLKVTEVAAGCDYRIDANLKIKDLNACSELQGAPHDKPTVADFEPFQALEIGDGLYVESIVDNCTYKIALNFVIKEQKSANTCPVNATLTEWDNTRGFIFGDGITVSTEEDDCYHKLEVKKQIQDLPYCTWKVPDLTVATETSFELLKFRKGLQVTKDGDCAFIIDSPLLKTFYRENNQDKSVTNGDVGDDIQTLVFNGPTPSTTYNYDSNECKLTVTIGSTLTVYDSNECDLSQTSATQITDIAEIDFGKGLKVTDQTNGRVLVDSDINILKYDSWTWQNYNFNCSFFDLLGVGKGLKVRSTVDFCDTYESTCHSIIESDFRIEKVGTECSDQEGDPNKGVKNPAGYRTDYLQFGDNIKVSTAEEKVRLDVCVPDPLLSFYPCGSNQADTAGLLSAFDNIFFEGFGFDDATEGDLTIKHEHYAYGGCNGASEGYGEDIYSADLGSFGYKFQDLNFGECFKVSKSSANTPNADIGACTVDIDLCGYDGNPIEVVCDVYCQNNMIVKKTLQMTYCDGLLKDVTDCESEAANAKTLRTSAVIGDTDSVAANETLTGGTSIARAVSAGSGPVTITLPPGSEMLPYQVIIVKTDASANAVTVVADAADGGGTVRTLTNQNEKEILHFIGSAWY